ncbi:MAG: FAD-dependent oxidoreductase, partial [Planctomycetota bacterium]
MSEVRQATVVGGGVVGCCAAYYLARLGCQVTLLERRELGHGASHGNCGYLCPSHVFPLATPTAVAETLPHLLRRDGA